MTSKATPVATHKTPDAQLIFDLATGFMRAKHLFAASELGVFEALGERPATLNALAARLKIPRRTTRIVADAVTALGLLERHGDKYSNSQLAQAYLSGRGSIDMRQFIRFWNRLSYRRWLGLEDSVRKGKGVAGEFNFTAEEQKIFSEGVEAFSAAHAAALAATYDFSRHPLCSNCQPLLQSRAKGWKVILWAARSTSRKVIFSKTFCQKGMTRSCWPMSCTHLRRNRTLSCCVKRERPSPQALAC